MKSLILLVSLLLSISLSNFNAQADELTGWYNGFYNPQLQLYQQRMNLQMQKASYGGYVVRSQYQPQVVYYVQPQTQPQPVAQPQPQYLPPPPPGGDLPPQYQPQYVSPPQAPNQPSYEELQKYVPKITSQPGQFPVIVSTLPVPKVTPTPLIPPEAQKNLVDDHDEYDDLSMLEKNKQKEESDLPTIVEDPKHPFTDKDKLYFWNLGISKNQILSSRGN